jgi:predicted acyltransferase
MKMDRLSALDALRGLAIFGMLLSGQLPQRVLPGWMYHAQNPPPLHSFNPALPGISWVDLVFPIFLFALGVAIPMAMAPALARGQSFMAAAWGVLRRFLLLLLFAIYVRHISPHVVELGEQWQDAVYALAGLLLLFPILVRLPATMTPVQRLAMRIAGYGGAVVLMLLFRDAKGATFSVARSDIIMLVLANVALTGGLIWLCTQRRPLWRLGILCFLLALRLSHEVPGWGLWVWNLSPLPVLVNVAFQQYLFVVLPGTIAGDLLLRAARLPAMDCTRQILFAALCLFALLVACVAGLYARWWLATFFAVVVLGGATDIQLKMVGNLYWRRLLGWGMFFLLLGLAFEPFEGGIQKGVATLSYYFVGAGAGFVLLLALLCVGPWREGRALAPLLGAGQNPLLAYTCLHTLVTPLLVLSGMAPVIAAWSQGALAGSIKAFVMTAVVCALAAWCVRRKLMLRA